MKKYMAAGVASVLAIIAYTQLTFFVIPPVGAIPEGRTVVILRLRNTQFIDSPDAMCQRIQGGVSLLCRAFAMGSALNNSKILFRLPYMDWLYLASTGGKRYDR